MNSEVTAKVFQAIDGLKDELVATVSAAVQIPSVNPKYPGQDYDAVVGGEGKVSRFVGEVYEKIGMTVDLFAIEEGRENAVGVLKGSGGGRSLMFNGHVDVVPVGDPANWKSGDPFSGAIRDGKIWGRGSTDMKGGILAQAFAVRAIRESGIKLKGDVICTAVAGEEVMDHECGATAVIRRGYTADACVVSEASAPPVPLAVVPVSGGLWWFSVSVTGKATHASMRGPTTRAGGDGATVGVSAIDKGIRIYEGLRDLEEQWGLSKKHPLFAPGHFSILPGVIVGHPEGVMVPFFIPDKCTIEYCAWYPPQDDPSEIQREIEEHISKIAALDPWLREHPPVTEWKLNWPANVPEAEEITAVACIAHELASVGSQFEGPAQLAGFAAVHDASFFTIGGVPAINYGPGDLRVAHADDEFISIDELVVSCKAYAAMALEWCGYDS
jgi:acetylornithine deacetylase/succinyl-diaminopimelate desuccinylase family protein